MATPGGPYGNFNFVVEIDGLSIASFAECTGLSTRVEVIVYREGGDKIARKLPGRSHVGDIRLRRGVMQSAELQQWHANILHGVADRRNGAIVLLDETKSPVVRWRFVNAFPSAWEGPDLDATGNDIAIETLVLCCEGLERA